MTTPAPSSPAPEEPTARVALSTPAELGECPRWHAGEARLYWVDIARCALHRFDPARGTDEARRFAAPVGCFAFVAGGGLMLGMKDGFAFLSDWAAEPIPYGPRFLAGRPDLRLNDGRTDSRGRFWAGSVNTAKSAADAALYRLEADGTVRTVAGGMLTCNGAAFDAGDRHFFHADTPTHRVRRYTLDPQGDLADERPFHQFPMGRGRPDGGSADEAGFYWSALFDGGRVVRLAPDGAIVASVALPVSRPTMIAFGGEDRRTAYVTSARAGLSADALAREPLAGSIFSFRVAIPGVPEHPYRSLRRPPAPATPAPEGALP